MSELRFGYWLPVFGGWLRNVEDEGMEASWRAVRNLAVRSERIGFDLTLIAELLLNDIIPNELRAPLPLRFRPAQDLALAELLVYAAIIDHLGVRDTGLVVGL